MDQYCQPQAKLLCIPREIRIKIIRLSFGEHTFHITSEGSHRCVFKRMSGPEITSERTQSDRCYGCTDAKLERLPGLTGVCRLLFHEANDILYSQTVLSFRSPQVLLDFFSLKPLALRSVRAIQLRCGAAKHNPCALKRRYSSALSFLVRHTSNLSKLYLQFGIYYGIRRDRHLFSNFWYHKLCQIASSSQLQLFLILEINLPGPIGKVIESEFETQSAQQRLRAKILCTEEAIRMHSNTLCKPEGRPNKTQMHQLKKEIVLRTEREIHSGNIDTGKVVETTWV